MLGQKASSRRDQTYGEKYRSVITLGNGGGGIAGIDLRKGHEGLSGWIFLTGEGYSLCI